MNFSVCPSAMAGSGVARRDKEKRDTNAIFDRESFVISNSRAFLLAPRFVEEERSTGIC